jgi:flagellar biogenesis protein FliO
MWKNVIEVLAGSQLSQLEIWPRSNTSWLRVLGEVGLLLGFVLASSWLVYR